MTDLRPLRHKARTIWAGCGIVAVRVIPFQPWTRRPNGGAETVHLYLKSNGQEIHGELRKPREIVVVGSKVKDVI